MKIFSHICLLAISLAVLWTECSAQETSLLDSLKGRLETRSSPAEKARILLEISDEYGREPDSLLRYATESLRIARQTSDSLLMFRTATKTLYAYTYFDHSEQIIELGEEFLPQEPQIEDTLLRLGFLNILSGFGYYPLGRIQDHLKMQEKALTMIESSSNYLREASMIAFNLYQGYYSIGQPNAGTIWMEKIRQKASQVKDSSAMIRILILLGQTTDFIERERGPLSYFSEAYHIAERLADTVAIAEVSSFIGQAYEREGKIDSAIFYVNNAILLNKVLGNPGQEMFARFVLGTLYRSSEKYDLALKQLSEAKVFFAKSDNRIQLIDIEAEIGLVLIGLGRKAEGLQQLTQMVDSAKYYDYQKGLTTVYINLAEAYQAIGNFEKALTVKDSLLKFQEKAFKFQQDEINKQVAIQNESQQKELENTVLRLNNLNLKAKSRRRLTIIVLSIMAVFIIGMVSIFLRNKWKIERIYRIELDKKIKEQTQHLSNSVQKLTKANEDLLKFTFLASHNFKTSIRTVKSIADLLKIKNSEQAPENIAYLDLIAKAGIDMNNTLDSLTTYFDLRESEVHLSTVDLATLCPIVAEEIWQLYPEKQAKIRCDGLGTINGNVEELTLMIRHLLDNSMTYHNPGQNPEILMSGKQNSTGFEFRISDNGLGINPEYQEQIFEAFTRLHSSASYEGVGIGLAIIKRIVDRHQATIRVESQLGEGSSFIVQFPKSPDSPQR